MSGLETQGLLLAQAEPNTDLQLKLTADSTAAVIKSDSGKNDAVMTKLGRVGAVTGEGFLYSIPGFGHAVADDFHHPLHFFEKLGGGMAVGAIMKTVLPESGVGRAVAGTIMLGYMGLDLVRPWWHARGVAWNSNNANKLDAAAQGLGDGLGKFAWDNVIGMAGGVAGEKLTGAALEGSMGSSKYSAFESAKVKFWNTREGKAGQYLVPLSETMDRWTSGVKQSLNPRSIVTRLQGKEALDAVAEAAKNVHRAFEGSPFYKRPEFSAFIDHLTGEGPPVPLKVVGIDPAKGILRVQLLFRKDAIGRSNSHLDGLNDGKAAGSDGSGATDPADDEIHIRVPSVDHSPEPVGPVEDAPGDTAHGHKGKPESGDGKPTTSGDQKPTDKLPQEPTAQDGTPAPGDKGAADTTKTGGKPIKVTTPAEEFSADNLRKAAQVAADEQAKWANTEEQDKQGVPNRAQIEDFKVSIKAPITAVRGNERLIAPQYDQGLTDVANLTDKLNSPETLQQAGPILQFHGQAAAQVLLRYADTMDLNNLSMELHSIFLQGMRDIGITKLDGKVPSWVAITDDQGSGNFTIAAIKNVLSLPVTVFPRSQTSLLAVFAAINGHEMLGHDYIYPELARFPKEYRASVLAKAVQAAFKNNNIADTDIKVPNTSMIGQEEEAAANSSTTPAAEALESAHQQVAAGDKSAPTGETTMKKSEFFIKMLEAEANENTADMMGTAATGTGTPISLGVLLQSLRRGGLLETRNVFGKQFPNLVEPHGFDRWRIKLCAETIRHLSDQDPRAMEIAKALDKYADSASRAGDDYVLASMDDKGETIKIPQAEWDAVIPEIVKAQFETGLPSFRVPKSKVPAGYVDKTVRKAGEPDDYVDMTLKDVVGKHFLENLRKTDDLATQMANAISNGNTSLDNFDPAKFKQQYGVNNIFNASLLAWVRATARGEDPEASLDAVSKLSADLRALYRTGSNPHVAPLEVPTLQQFIKAPVETTKNGLLATIGNVVGSQDKVRTWIDKRSNMVSGVGGALLAQDLIDHYRLTHELASPEAPRSGQMSPNNALRAAAVELDQPQRL